VRSSFFPSKPMFNLRAPSSDKSDVSQSALTSALANLSDSNRALRLRLEDNENLIRNALAMLSENVSASAVLEEIPVHAAEITAMKP
jgi:K+-transporting ATPase c subunit